MIIYEKGEQLYEGKAKRLYAVKDRADLIWQDFKDSLTAFNALKKGEFENKGPVNRDITSLIFRLLEKRSIKTHWLQDIGSREMVTQRLDMIKVEVVVRNILAGSTAKKFAIEEGQKLERPLLELFYKDDALGDPFINDEQALMMKIVKAQSDLDKIKVCGYAVNAALTEIFAEVGIDLVDFKIEVGFDKNHNVILADEITPDSCRLWDSVTKQKMDKDRFRRDLGQIKESYDKVYDLLKKRWESSL